MHVLVVTVDLHIPGAQSLKAKRSTVLSLVRRLDQLHGVGAAEVDHLDVWQRTTIGVSIVGSEVGHVQQVTESVERMVWAQPDVEVLSIEQSWWDNS